MAKSRKTFTILAVLAILLAIGLILNTQIQSFQIFGEEVYRVNYWSASCDAKTTNLQTNRISSHTDNPTWYHCTTEGARDIGLSAYVPSAPGIQCEYEFRESNNFAKVYICEGFTENDGDLNSNVCELIYDNNILTVNIPQPPQDIFSVSLDSGNTLWVDTARTFGNAELYVKYPDYGLNIIQGDQFRSPQTDTCLLNTLDSELHTLNAEDAEIVVPGIPFNVVEGLTPAITSQAVVLDNVENGKPIYISRVTADGGYYWLIKEAEDGFLYVDSSVSEKKSSEIQCIPRTTGCSDEAKLIPLEQQECSSVGGTPVGYAPVAGNPTEVCTYECVNGNPKPTTDCVEIPAECPEGTDWSSLQGKCVEITLLADENSKNNLQGLLVPLLIIIGAILLAVLMFFIATGKIGIRRVGK